MLNLNSKLERKVVAHENVFRAVWKSLLGDEGIQGGGADFAVCWKEALRFCQSLGGGADYAKY